jgi:hypothetical protein
LGRPTLRSALVTEVAKLLFRVFSTAFTQKQPIAAAPCPTLNARNEMSDQHKNPSAGHCTGPRSGAGKEKSSRNAATHGLTCKKFFLIPDETEEEFLAHAQIWADEYAADSSPAIQALLQDLVEAHWLQKRASRRMFESESALAMAETDRDSSEMADQIFKRLRNIQRYKTSYENSFQRALRAIEAFRKNRLAQRISDSRLAKIELSTEAIKVKSRQAVVNRKGSDPIPPPKPHLCCSEESGFRAACTPSQGTRPD